MTTKKKAVMNAKQLATKHHNKPMELPAGASLKELLLMDEPRADLLMPNRRLLKLRNVKQLP
jgi:hypothetical protein